MSDDLTIRCYELIKRFMGDPPKRYWLDYANRAYLAGYQGDWDIWKALSRALWTEVNVFADGWLEYAGAAPDDLEWLTAVPYAIGALIGERLDAQKRYVQGGQVYISGEYVGELTGGVIYDELGSPSAHGDTEPG